MITEAQKTCGCYREIETGLWMRKCPPTCQCKVCEHEKKRLLDEAIRVIHDKPLLEIILDIMDPLSQELIHKAAE